MNRFEIKSSLDDNRYLAAFEIRRKGLFPNKILLKDKKKTTEKSCFVSKIGILFINWKNPNNFNRAIKWMSKHVRSMKFNECRNKNETK